MDSSIRGELEVEFSQRCVWINGAIIVGGGPSGLATGACLKEKGVPCVILEKADCIASLWQHRTYDCLKFHLPKRFCELPYIPFPKDFPTYPTKHQFIRYLESYAQHFKLSLRFNECVESASYDESSGMWRVCTVKCGGEEKGYICRWVIAATGENAEPRIPDIKGMELFKGPIIHACSYKNGADFEGQNVLVVGCANSGMEISLDLASHNSNPFMVVRSSVHVLPRDMFGVSTFGIAIWLLKQFPIWLVDCFLLCLAWVVFGNTNKYGIKRPTMGPLQLKYVASRTPVLDMGSIAKIKKGEIKVVPALDFLTYNRAKFMNGEEMEFDSIILATGYKSNISSWLKDVKLFLEDGIPNGWKGEKGVYAVGFTRQGLLGVSMDAMHIAQDIETLWKNLNK